jgi:alpha-acetolactate decarboxylase
MLLCLKQLKETLPHHDVLGSLSVGVPHGTISIMQVLKAGRSVLVPA